MFEKLRRVFWRFKQPLTKVPAVPGAPISDLFVWRHSDEWETFFELTDLVSLFSETGQSTSLIHLMFFDAAGRLFLKSSYESRPCSRQTIAISELVGADHGSIGTFAVFHSGTPQEIQTLGAFVAERGYVSYRYRKAALRSYVHGNFDAIALLTDGNLQLLGGTSLRARDYNLQLKLVPECYYEIIIVNPTNNIRSVQLKRLTATGEFIDSAKKNLKPGGVLIFKVSTKNQPQRIVITSNLVMARPIVFRFLNQSMDVFHG